MINMENYVQIKELAAILALTTVRKRRYLQELTPEQLKAEEIKQHNKIIQDKRNEKLRLRRSKN